MEKISLSNKNFRYFLWTIFGLIIFIALTSAYVYISDTGIQMGNTTITNVSNPVNPQDVATKDYVDYNNLNKNINYTMGNLIYSNTEYQTIINYTGEGIFLEVKQYSVQQMNRHMNITIDGNQYKYLTSYASATSGSGGAFYFMGIKDYYHFNSSLVITVSPAYERSSYEVSFIEL